MFIIHNIVVFFKNEQRISQIFGFGTVNFSLLFCYDEENSMLITDFKKRIFFKVREILHQEFLFTAFVFLSAKIAWQLGQNVWNPKPTSHQNLYR